MDLNSWSLKKKKVNFSRKSHNTQFTDRKSTYPNEQYIQYIVVPVPPVRYNQSVGVGYNQLAALILLRKAISGGEGGLIAANYQDQED